MPKTREQKTALLESYRQTLSTNPNYIIVDTTKVNMTHITGLKKELRESNASYQVVKNTIFKIAAEEAHQPTKVQELTDAAGVIVCGDEPTAAARALRSIQKEFEVMATRFGVLFGDILEPDQIQQLAEIPSRPELLSMLVGSMQSPIAGFTRVIGASLGDFVRALAEVQKSRETAASAA